MAGDPEEDKWERMLVAGPAYCVACGLEIETTDEGYANHRCPDRRESARLAAGNRDSEPSTKTPSLWERLEDGFEMLTEEEHGR